MSNDRAEWDTTGARAGARRREPQLYDIPELDPRRVSPRPLMPTRETMIGDILCAVIVLAVMAGLVAWSMWGALHL